MTTNLSYLEERGPTAVPSLPADVTVEDKQAGLHLFSVSADSARVAITFFESHSRTNVLHRFFDENERFHEVRSLRGVKQILKRQGASWSDHDDHVVAEYYDSDEEFSTEFAGNRDKREGISSLWRGSR